VRVKLNKEYIKLKIIWSNWILGVKLGEFSLPSLQIPILFYTPLLKWINIDSYNIGNILKYEWNCTTLDNVVIIWKKIYAKI